MRRAPILVGTLLASVLLAACGSSSSSTTGSSSASTAAAVATPSSTPASAHGLVRTASNSSAGGTILVDAEGKTLYSLSGEQGGKFICTSSACVSVWHPLKASGLGTPTGSVAALGTVKRPDGSVQVTYKGMPLYTFAQDTKPGQTNGQGVKDVGVWSVISVGGSSSSSSSTTASPSSVGSGESTESSKPSGGYAY
jgi:predicted lipoprotein with Yx(FWY)xxD motif